MQRQQENNSSVLAFVHGNSLDEDVVMEDAHTTMSDARIDQESSQDDDDDARTTADYANEDVPEVDRVLIRRIVNRLLSSGADDTTYSQGKARIFAILCNVLEIDYTHIDLARKSAKRFLYDSILGSVGTITLLIFTD